MTHSYVWHESFTYQWNRRRLRLFLRQLYTWVTLRHDSFTCVTWLVHMCDMTRSHVWHDSCTCMTWLIHMCDMTRLHVWHDSCTRVTWLMHKSDMTNSHATWLMHKCDLTNSHVWHDLHITLVIWLIHTCDTTHSHMWHDPFIHEPCLILSVTFIHVAFNATWCIHIPLLIHCSNRTPHPPFVTTGQFWISNYYRRNCLRTFRQIFCSPPFFSVTSGPFWVLSYCRTDTIAAIPARNFPIHIPMGWLWLVGSLQL